MRIAVTGTSGLIGSAVMRKFGCGHEIVRVGRRQDCDRIADLSVPAAVEALDFSGMDAVIHCAGVVDEDFRNDREAAFRLATLGADALVQRAAADGVPVFAYVSSAHVYGPLSGTFREDSPPNPLHDYAIAQFATEQILRRSAGKFAKTAVFRPCAVFGMPPALSGFRRWSLIPFSFPRDAFEKNEIVLLSSGMQQRNFVATDDIADAIAGWLTRNDMEGFMPFNPVGASTLTVLNFARLCARECEQFTGRPCAIRTGSGGAADSLHYETRHDFCRGSAELGQAVRDLLDALQREAAHDGP